MSDKPRPFREGREAYRSKKTLADNPYTGRHGESWVFGYEAEEMDQYVATTPIPDISLIAEAENLIPKGFYWCGHELSRHLLEYQERCNRYKRGEIPLEDLKNWEKIIRKTLVKARLEAANLK